MRPIGQYDRERWVKHSDITGHGTEDDEYSGKASIILKQDIPDIQNKKVCFRIEGSGLYDGRYRDAVPRFLPDQLGYYMLTIDKDWKGEPEENGDIDLYFHEPKDTCPLQENSNVHHLIGLVLLLLLLLTALLLTR